MTTAIECLGSETSFGSMTEVFSELDHLREIFCSLADRLTDEEHWNGPAPRRRSGRSWTKARCSAWELNEWNV